MSSEDVKKSEDNKKSSEVNRVVLKVDFQTCKMLVYNHDWSEKKPREILDIEGPGVFLEHMDSKFIFIQKTEGENREVFLIPKDEIERVEFT